jgi:anti-sigma regulatory factor (Ser/Thr protein kinase)
MKDRKDRVEALFDRGRSRRAGEIADALEVTRQTAHRYLRQLVSEGRLIREGAGRGVRYRLASFISQDRFLTKDLEEDRVWEEISGAGSVFDRVPKRARTILHYVLTELVNNVIDHSGASEVFIEASLEGGTVALVVRDHGVGIFRHIRECLDMPSELDALQELSKGKTTTMPDKHTGEGIFFSSRVSSWFEISSGGLRWVVDNRRGDMAVGSLEPLVAGTTIRIEVDPSEARDLTEVFDEYTEEFEFSKTRTVVKLFAYGTEFVSRSQAKRLVHGLERFREVVLDFKDVDLVGQGFADEVFRVWASRHPEVHLVPVGMNDAVAFMVRRSSP